MCRNKGPPDHALPVVRLRVCQSIALWTIRLARSVAGLPGPVYDHLDPTDLFEVPRNQARISGRLTCTKFEPGEHPVPGLATPLISAHHASRPLVRSHAADRFGSTGGCRRCCSGTVNATMRGMSSVTRITAGKRKEACTDHVDNSSPVWPTASRSQPARRTRRRPAPVPTLSCKSRSRSASRRAAQSRRPWVRSIYPSRLTVD